MITFGLITEGLTDRIVIENILTGYFGTPDLVINPLQPERDKDDDNKSSNYGGWTQVFDYCQSTDFKEAFQFNDYAIVQVDTDVSEEINFDVPHRDEAGAEFSPEQLIIKVIEKFRNLIGADFHDRYREKLIYAISVHSVECWLLPLYYTDNKKAKIKSCLKTLNRALDKKEGFTIDKNAKKPEYYRAISKKYCKPKTLKEFYKLNPSFKSFIEQLNRRNIVIEEEDY
ncbi:MAG: phage tail protein [Cyanobacteriota bacterium]|nr:phage tail protein [Cyanobacteriota bacterium]